MEQRGVVPLGLNVYFWGSGSKNRLVVECLGPLARELREERKMIYFWYDRFDARSPHVFTILCVYDSALEEVRERLSARLDWYLKEFPSTEVLSQQEVEVRHAACRGKALCEADRYPGPAPNNSYHLFVHPREAYPFSVSMGLSRRSELWELVDDLVFWSVEQLARRPMMAAVHWLARLDLELNQTHLGSSRYWRYHAGTLMVNLEELLESEGESFLDAIRILVGRKNTETFTRVWEEVESAPRQAPWPHFPQLLDVIFNEPGWPTNRKLALLREITHWTLKQLGVSVGLYHIPLIFFAWSRSLSLLENVKIRGMDVKPAR